MFQNAEQKNKTNLTARPPVVVIMGHVDHGKTSILDAIRKTKIADAESGGITQHIGAYQVEHQGKRITFIDTPGHEAFYAMRSRGAKVADIAVLVVAADDGVMKQTKEAIQQIKQAGVSMIVAINKIDKENADPMRVKNQLLSEEIVVEDFKGDVPVVLLSAKTGEGIDGLLEIINLVGEVAELKSDTEAKTQGVIIEAELNHQRGPAATLLVKEGVLKVGSIVGTSSTFGKIKSMENFLGEELTEAGPGTPALVIGFSEVARVGDEFFTYETIEEAQQKMAEKIRRYGEEREVFAPSQNQKITNIVIKADAEGTLEAVREIVRSIESGEMALRVLSQEVGDIMESDIKLASHANALLVGFRVKINSQVEDFARQMKVEVVLSDIIYELVEKVRKKLNELASTERVEVIIGTYKVLAIFHTEKSRIISGGKVTDGEVKRGAYIRVFRAGALLGEGRVGVLKIQDKTVQSVEKGKECGLLFEGPVRIQVGDEFQVFETRETRIQL